MTDIYKEQKDEVEIRTNQLKERRKKQCRNQNCREYITPINERVANVTNIVIGESWENLKVVFAMLVLVCF